MKLLGYDYHNNKLVIKKNNGKIVKHTHYPNTISVEESSISCGVMQVTNINALATNVSNFCKKNEFMPLRKEIFKAVFLGTIKLDKYLEDYDNAMYLASTNLTNNPYKKLIEKAMGELSSCKSRARKNPNSGNKIRVWVIPNTSL
jgi:hypothetical protein